MTSIRLMCVNGVTKKGDECTYEMTYTASYVVAARKKNGQDFDCPICKKRGLRAYQEKTSA